jgi:hypothetical protein
VLTSQRQAYLAAYLERFGRIPSSTPEFRAAHRCPVCEAVHS